MTEKADKKRAAQEVTKRAEAVLKRLLGTPKPAKKPARKKG